ncbi:putative Thymocyte nuclear protein 1 [Cardiosporidium cionae]|uniref:Thymocyte nuclear protein 1 n=1 Tax=Cardiosporidium cionae TaxID=476202 RepID=A0ABQ7J643_9APIC|nr:putative Thymocyte nuclear protein 1 [Cardiosporidium cionae]|eukprot:KAF8819469.1 putative Thymocyte nuclear protein 1 [Cardiosporidium cionae]
MFPYRHFPFPRVIFYRGALYPYALFDSSQQVQMVESVRSRKRKGGESSSTGNAAKITRCKAPVTEENSSKRFFLIKSEPLSRFEKGNDMKFSFDDLLACPQRTTDWDGIRNYKARNTLRRMRHGDEAFFYHSNCKSPAIVGFVAITREAFPDVTQFKPNDPHYDAKSTIENPRWDAVDITYTRALKRPLYYEELKQYKNTELKNSTLFRLGRLSVHEFTKEEWDFICGLEHKEP